MVFLFQLMMIGYAATAAWMQSTVIKTFIDYVPIGVKYEKWFHTAGATMTTIVAMIIAFAIGGASEALLMFAVCLLWYWVVFDCVLGKLLHNDWFYIGQTAKIDKLLNKHLGEYAGIVKPLVVGVVVLVINFYL